MYGMQPYNYHIANWQPFCQQTWPVTHTNSLDILNNTKDLTKILRKMSTISDETEDELNNNTLQNFYDEFLGTSAKIERFVIACEFLIGIRTQSAGIGNLESLKKVFWLMYNRKNHALKQAFVKQQGYVSRTFFSKEGWHEWLHSKTCLGRIACLFANYAQPKTAFKFDQIKEIDINTLKQANLEAEIFLREDEKRQAEDDLFIPKSWDQETIQAGIDQLHKIVVQIYKFFPSINDLANYIKIFCDTQDDNFLTLFDGEKIKASHKIFHKLDRLFASSTYFEDLITNGIIRLELKDLRNLILLKDSFDEQEVRFLRLLKKDSLIKEYSTEQASLQAYNQFSTFSNSFFSAKSPSHKKTRQEMQSLDKALKAIKKADLGIQECEKSEQKLHANLVKILISLASAEDFLAQWEEEGDPEIHQTIDSFKKQKDEILDKLYAVQSAKLSNEQDYYLALETKTLAGFKMTFYDRYNDKSILEVIEANTASLIEMSEKKIRQLDEELQELC